MNSVPGEAKVGEMSEQLPLRGFDSFHAGGGLEDRFGRTHSEKIDLTPFSRGMFIAGLVFCGIRIVMVALAFLGYSTIRQQQADHPLLSGIRWEIVTGIGIVAFGITANVLLLSGNRRGIPLGWCLVAAVVGSVAVGLLQTSIQFSYLPYGSPERVRAWIGLVSVLAIRAGLLAGYAVALRQTSALFDRHSSSSPNE
ncbi:MAG: hypothetical protein R3C49_08280 [Planctomycetaceae bacterium]